MLSGFVFLNAQVTPSMELCIPYASPRLDFDPAVLDTLSCLLSDFAGILAFSTSG